MVELFTYYYRAFGLKIASQLQVAGFEPVGPFTDPDVIINEDSVPKTIDPVINKGILFESNDHEFLLRLDSVAAYYVRNGNTITVQKSGNPNDTDISAFIIGTAFGALLLQRRLLPLHASTVIYNDKCMVMMGMSGAGKTTLAAALVKKGALLVADDISVIDFSTDNPSVYPAFPSVKIWEDSLRHLGYSSYGLMPVREELKKYHLPVEEFNGNIKPAIDRIFVLNSHNKPQNETKSLSGIEKFQIIKKHTYLFRSIPNTGIEQNHFKLATELASKIPVAVLTRSDSMFDTDSLIRIISESL